MEMYETKSILEEALEIRKGSRASDYGNAVENFKNISDIATAMTGVYLSPEICCTVMIAVKFARERFKHRRDNLVDACGYADILHLIRGSIEAETDEYDCRIRDNPR